MELYCSSKGFCCILSNNLYNEGEYPNAQKAYSKTEFILNEIVSDQNGNIIKTTEKTFSDKKSMDIYQKDKEAKNKESDVTIFTVEPGQTVYSTNYTQIQVGLSLYKYSSDYYFVAFVYDWLTPPPTTLLDYTHGAVGLGLESLMSMNGTSFAGRVTAVLLTSGTVDERTTYNGGLMIKSDSNNAIGYAFSLPYATSDIYGVISCSAYKGTPATNYCSAFGEYNSINRSINFNEFSISYPAGISFNVSTTRARYTYGDALHLQ